MWNGQQERGQSVSGVQGELQRMLGREWDDCAAEKNECLEEERGRQMSTLSVGDIYLVLYSDDEEEEECPAGHVQ